MICGDLAVAAAAAAAVASRLGILLNRLPEELLMGVGFDSSRLGCLLFPSPATRYANFPKEKRRKKNMRKPQWKPISHTTLQSHPGSKECGA